MKRIFRCRKCKYEFIIRAPLPEAEVNNVAPKDPATPSVKIRCPKCSTELTF